MLQANTDSNQRTKPQGNECHERCEWDSTRRVFAPQKATQEEKGAKEDA
jgi:hypothetical protein